MRVGCRLIWGLAVEEIRQMIVSAENVMSECITRLILSDGGSDFKPRSSCEEKGSTKEGEINNVCLLRSEGEKTKITL